MPRTSTSASYEEGREAEVERRLGACPSEPAARRLLELMRDISEDHHSAGWMRDLEKDLWLIREGGEREYEFRDVSEERVVELRRLSIECDGWWIWREDARDGLGEGELFVRLAEWAGAT